MHNDDGRHFVCPKQLYKADTISSISRIRKLRYKELKLLASVDTGSNWKAAF